MKFGLALAALVATVTAQDQTITDIVVGTDDFSTLETALVLAGLADTLADEGPFTAFAPNNAAFEEISGVVDQLTKPLAASGSTYSKDLLSDVLKNHVAAGSINSTVLVAAGSATVLNGNVLELESNPLRLGGAELGETLNLAAKNGIIHSMKQVIVPADLPTTTITDTAVDSKVHETLVAALKTANLTGTFQNAADNTWTVFAPTDTAFATLLSDLNITAEALLADSDLLVSVLQVHVVAETYTTVDEIPEIVETLGGSIPKPEIEGGPINCLNGVIFLPKAVILPPPVEAPKNVLDVITEVAPTLAAVIPAAYAAAANSSESSLTVFAPEDAAFGKIQSIVAHLLLDNEYNKAQLGDVIAYHILGEKKLSTELSAEETALNGATISVGDGVLNGNAKITSVDVEASNGVVHVIDSVLVPPSLPVKTIYGTLARDSFLKLALDACGLEKLLDEPAANGKPFTVFAPTDDAFVAALTALGLSQSDFEGEVDASIKDLITKILTYHVVAGVYKAKDVVEETTLEALGGKIVVADLKIKDTDILALNGVVHTLDAVYVSDDIELPAQPTEAPTPKDSAATGVVPQVLALAALLVNILA